MRLFSDFFPTLKEGRFNPGIKNQRIATKLLELESNTFLVRKLEQKLPKNLITRLIYTLEYNMHLQWIRLFLKKLPYPNGIEYFRFCSFCLFPKL